MRAFVVCSLLLFFITGCSKQNGQNANGINVTAFKVEPQDIPAEFEFVGVTKSSHPVEIRARVEGYLMSIDYVEGSQVKANDLLFRLDPREFEASVAEAKGVLTRQEAVLWRAQRNLERMEPLFDKNAVSERDLDNAKAAVLSAEAEVISAKAKLTLAELNLSYTCISSPIQGLSGRALYREGTLITPSINGLLTYIDVLNPIWVYFSLTENEVLKRRWERKQEQIILPDLENYRVKLQLADGRFFPYDGKVNFTAPILDRDTGTMAIRATFPNPDEDLLPGQFVRVYVLGAYRPNALFVPQKSIVQGKKGKFVYVIDENNQVAIRDIEVGNWYQDYWIVLVGLQKGDIVVADGVNKIQDGSAVHITEFESPKFKSESALGEAL